MIEQTFYLALFYSFDFILKPKVGFKKLFSFIFVRLFFLFEKI
ncbi:hypothetical protein IX297_000824 [Bacteroides pyogenes]|nr:hypothetical protein [Bacteroides pyogenes]MBR8794900.1 hypothetical protein [Bacteroides pyogenes]